MKCRIAEPAARRLLPVARRPKPRQPTGAFPVEIGYQGPYVDHRSVTLRAQLQTLAGPGRASSAVALEPRWRGYEDRTTIESKFTGRMGLNLERELAFFLEGFRAFGDYFRMGSAAQLAGRPLILTSGRFRVGGCPTLHGPATVPAGVEL